MRGCRPDRRIPLISSGSCSRDRRSVWPRRGCYFWGAALTLALGDLTILNVSVGRVLLCALLAYTAYDRGPLPGVTAGLGLGLMTDLAVGSSGLFTAAYGAAALLAARCSRRPLSAAAFFLGALAAMMTSREELAQSLLLETAAGALLFLAIPGRAFGGKRIQRAEAADSAQKKGFAGTAEPRGGSPAGAVRQHEPHGSVSGGKSGSDL